MRVFLYGFAIGVGLCLLLLRLAAWSGSKESGDSVQRLGRTKAATSSVVGFDSQTESKVRVFCWIPSRGQQGPILDRIVRTWGKTCDQLLFTSTKDNPELNVVRIEYPLDRNLWNMIHPAWTYVEEHFLDQYDWFVKADDDTYFSGDNFRSLVENLDPDEPYYLGHTTFEQTKSITDLRTPFNLGAGHALSRGSLRRMAPYLPNSKHPLPSEGERCPRAVSWAEDVKLGECLWHAGIGAPNNTRDAWGRENFMAFPPDDNFMTVRRPDSASWFWRGKPRWVGSGAHCCSSRPILWHGLKDSRSRAFYYIHYFLYHVLVDPISRSGGNLP